MVLCSVTGFISESSCNALAYTLEMLAGCVLARAKRTENQMGSDGAQEVCAEFAEEADRDLLLYMALADEDPLAARAAWGEFYQRHVDYVYAVSMRAFGAVLDGPVGVSDLLAETFRRAYEKAHLFDDGGIDDVDRARRRTRAWLGRIAHRLALTMLRGRRKVPTLLLEQDQWQGVSGVLGDKLPSNSPCEKTVRAAIATLNAKEQAVIRVTFQWYQVGRDHQRLPNDVAGDLARTLRTTPENLRQIRRRALGKIKVYLDALSEAGIDWRKSSER